MLIINNKLNIEGKILKLIIKKKFAKIILKNKKS